MGIAVEKLLGCPAPAPGSVLAIEGEQSIASLVIQPPLAKQSTAALGLAPALSLSASLRVNCGYKAYPLIKSLHAGQVSIT